MDKVDCPDCNKMNGAVPEIPQRTFTEPAYFQRQDAIRNLQKSQDKNPVKATPTANGPAEPGIIGRSEHKGDSMKSPERFTVSEIGLKARNSDREPWDLVKELIQNAWDEAPFAQVCHITAETNHDGTETTITVEDDGPGFDKIEDAYTLMGPTKKTADCTKRGRFNRGEKDVISLALEAQVETKGHTVIFPRDTEHGREQVANDRQRGTVVTVVMQWGPRDREQLIAKLMTLRPPIECPTYINEQQIISNPPIIRDRAQLRTVIQDSPESPVRNTRRHTAIEITEPHDPAGKARLYEMGLPVQEIDTPWDVDVMQKLPLDDRRNAVPDSYLKEIYREVLNIAHRRLDERHFAESWVTQALEQPSITPEAVRTTFQARYRNTQAVFASMDNDANNRARAHDYAVVDAQSLSAKVAAAFREHVGIEEASLKFGNPTSPEHDYEPEPGSNCEAFANWITETCKMFNLNVTVRFFNEPSNKLQADCEVGKTNPTMRLNQATLGDEFFEEPHSTREHWNLLLHEVAHVMTQSPEHGEEWGLAIANAGAIAAAQATSTHP